MIYRGVFIPALILWAQSLAADAVEPPATDPIKTLKNANNSGVSTVKTIVSHRTNGTLDFSPDSPMIRRALYVLIGITIIGVFYFLVRAVRLKKTKVQRKKYGLLSNEDPMEMEQLESDDDDTTVYEAKNLRR